MREWVGKRVARVPPFLLLLTCSSWSSVWGWSRAGQVGSGRGEVGQARVGHARQREEKERGEGRLGLG